MSHIFLFSLGWRYGFVLLCLSEVYGGHCELATRKSLLLKQLQVAILCFSSVYCGWREGLTIQEIIAEQRRRSVSANPAERLAAALLIPNLLRERLRSLPDCEIGELLEHEVCSNLSVLAQGFEVTREYCDWGISGSKARRPGLDALMADARRGSSPSWSQRSTGSPAARRISRNRGRTQRA